ncbi:hypothetical protein AVEN_193371-1 [Araneus ventricosus]|uniref:Uncharacterized protein n=1 Tax=Araneus ventricosus TaxID=182803 RepID=A0A4Y2TK48_ARAVE|nr:hypothetical protein AVEN_193371-1 [Araneus ventricosus]
MTLVELRDISSQVTSDNKSSLLVNGGIDNSKGDISVDIIDSTCASCQSKTFYKHRDFNMMRGKIVHPLDTEAHIIHNKKKCKICRSKWFREANLQAHLATNSVDDRSVV